MRTSIPSVTVGIDLASQAKRTSICQIDWSGGNIEVTFLDQTDDPGITELIRSATDDVTIGIDCPLGWPIDFVNLVAAHSAFRRLPSKRSSNARKPLDYLQHRLTDEFVWNAEEARPPLSVSTNLLGVVALRCAYILQDSGRPIDRSGMSGPVVEVYPAASLRRWRQVNKGDESYKRSPSQRKTIIDGIAAAMPIGDPIRTRCIESHDDLDAFVAALSARAAGLNRSTLPTNAEIARVEGWIHVPTCEIGELL